MEQEEVVYVKIFDEMRRDVLLEGKVSTDVEPGDLVHLRCFWDQGFYGLYNKETSEEVRSFKGLQNNVELVAGWFSECKDFSGVLYVGADDGVLRKSESVPSFECVMMSVGFLSQECEKPFKCETLEELEISDCILRQIPREIGRLKKLKKLRLVGLKELKSIPEEIGELSSLEELQIRACGIESLPKRLKELKMLKSITLDMLKVQTNAEDLVVFSKLKHLTIRLCSKMFTPPLERSFWEMIKSTTELRVLKLSWDEHNEEMVAAALEENGSIADGRLGSDSYAQIFKRNKENHERTLQCVLHLLAIRRWRNALNNVPKEMVRMISVMLWNTKCDVRAWRVGRGKQLFKTLIEKMKAIF